jgi:ribonuclease P protein component
MRREWAKNTGRHGQAMGVDVEAMTTSEFKLVRGRTVTVGDMKVRAVIDADGGTVKVGWVTPKRIGNAVARNRTRRRARVVVRDLADSGKLPAGRYIVSFNGTGPVDAAGFKADLATALTKAAHAKRR